MGKKKDNRNRLNDRFDIIIDNLGEGGNGKVSLAIDKLSGEKVAIKPLLQVVKKKGSAFG